MRADAAYLSDKTISTSDTRRSTPATASLTANDELDSSKQFVLGMLKRHEIVTPDGYEAAVTPLLPTVAQLEETMNEPSADIRKSPWLAFATVYKEAGNTLFKQGQHAWALRTYLVGDQFLQRSPRFGEALYDVAARPTFLALYSNAALMALKLERHALAAELCEHGMGLAPSGSDLVKLLHRKAQAELEWPEQSDPDRAVELLERAAEVEPSNKAVLSLLQKARKAAKNKEKAASKALFGGKGFGSARLSSSKSSKADALQESEAKLRVGHAALLGVSPSREVDPYPDARKLRGEEEPQKDAAAAKAAFVEAEQVASGAGLGAQRAQALFGIAAATSETCDWQAAADAWTAYCALEQKLSRAATVEGGVGREEPLLGAAYGYFHAGIALYHMREQGAAMAQFEAFLEAKSAFKPRRICLKDAFGNEVYPDLEKEVQRQREWMFAAHFEYSARRYLAHLLQLEYDKEASAAINAAANPADVHATAEARSLLSRAASQLEACLGLAGHEDKREVVSELEKTRTVLQQLEPRPPATVD